MLHEEAPLVGAFFLQEQVEVHDLFVMVCLAERPGFDEVTEVGCVGQFVDKGVRLGSVPFLSKFIKVEEVSRVGVIRDGSISVEAGVL